MAMGLRLGDLIVCRLYNVAMLRGLCAHTLRANTGVVATTRITSFYRYKLPLLFPYSTYNTVLCLINLPIILQHD